MERNVPAKWAVNLNAKMYRDRVTHQELADVLGCSRSYVTQMFSGSKTPPDAREKLEEAFQTVIDSRKEQ